MTDLHTSSIDVPQTIIDGYRGEISLLQYPNQNILVTFSDHDRYCPDCDEYVDPVTSITVTWISKDGTECEWEETGEQFCPECQGVYFANNRQEALEIAREDYFANRADAIRKGEW